MKILKKVCNLITAIIMVGMVGLAVVLFVPKLLGYETMAVLSGSMEPEIPVGSVVFTEEADAAELQVGDIITYAIGSGTRVTHRIVDINSEEQTFTTKGDANDVEDGNPVSFDSVVGKEKLHIPYLGYISIYIKTPLGVAAVCELVIVLILLIFLPDLLTADEEKKERKDKNSI